MRLDPDYVDQLVKDLEVEIDRNEMRWQLLIAVIAAKESLRELSTLLRGLKEMLYADEVYDGENSRPIWNPGMAVSGTDMVSWACGESIRLGLEPKPGPREV